MRVVILGAGFGGIAAAVELRQHGITDVTILEKAPDFGGTCFHNTYPGCACDVPSHLYSFSHAQRRDWSAATASHGRPTSLTTVTTSTALRSACCWSGLLRSTQRRAGAGRLRNDQMIR